MLLFWGIAAWGQTGHSLASHRRRKGPGQAHGHGARGACLRVEGEKEAPSNKNGGRAFVVLLFAFFETNKWMVIFGLVVDSLID